METTTILTVALKRLILLTNPIGVLTALLQLNGYGKSFKLDNSEDYGWEWNKEKIMELNEEELLRLINELTW